MRKKCIEDLHHSKYKDLIIFVSLFFLSKFFFFSSTIILQPNTQLSNSFINQQNEICNASPSQFENKLNYLRSINTPPTTSNYDQARINQLAYPPNSYPLNFIHHSRSASASPKYAI